MKPSLELIFSMTGAWAESLHVKGPDSQVSMDYMINRFFTTPTDYHPLADYYVDGKLKNAAGDFWRFGSPAFRTIPAGGLDADGEMDGNRDLNVRE